VYISDTAETLSKPIQYRCRKMYIQVCCPGLRQMSGSDDVMWM